MRNSGHKDPSIPHARNKKLLAILEEMRKEGLIQVDENGVWTVTAAGAAAASVQSEAQAAAQVAMSRFPN